MSATLNEKLENLLEKILSGKQFENNQEEEIDEHQLDEQEEVENKAKQETLNELKKLRVKKEKLDKVLDNFQMIGFDQNNLQKLKTPVHLKHFYTIIDQRKKMTLFIMLLKLIGDEKAIIFVSTADQANYLLELTQKFNISDPNLKQEE